jgi:hypothetical protein
VLCPSRAAATTTVAVSIALSEILPGPSVFEHTESDVTTQGVKHYRWKEVVVCGVSNTIKNFYLNPRSSSNCRMTSAHSQADFPSFLRFTIFTAPRTYSMTPFFCRTAAAKLTVDQSVPIMVAMKSWVIGSAPEPTRS